MKDYFKEVVDSLTLEDMFVLGVLHSHGADTGFKSMTKSAVIEAAKLTEATFRRTIYRLAANRFVEVVSIKKQNAMYLTQYGVKVIAQSFQEVGA